MNTVIYRAGYATMTVVEKIGHRIPRTVLAWCILHTPTEVNALRLYKTGRIDVDGFDLRADWHCVLIRAYRKKGL